ncbi:MAG: hypothetical protein WCJ95_12790 [Mariniphaga sp.]
MRIDIQKCLTWITILSFFGILVFSCKKDFSRQPDVITNVFDKANAIASGRLIDIGSDAISGHGFCWDTLPNPSLSSSKINLGTLMQIGDFQTALSGLLPSKNYYLKAFIIKANEGIYGSQISFKTPDLPTITTAQVSDIIQNSAKCGGSITADGGSPVTARGVCYSITAHPDLNGTHTSDGTGTGDFISYLNGLSPNTVYYIRGYASTIYGIAFGSEISFNTGQGVTSPVVTTDSVTAITRNSVICGGNVVSDGGSAVTQRGVCWSNQPYPTTTDSHSSDGTGAGIFVSTVSGLSTNTTYYLRAYAINSVGTSYGIERVFITLSGPVIPTVITTEVTNITTTSASTGGTVLVDGGATVAQRGVCWSTSPSPTTSNSHTLDGNGVGTFISSITGLISNQKYYVRAYAINSVGTAYGNEISFTAGQNASSPTVTTADAFNITQTTSSCGGNVTSDGGASVTSRGVCWSINHNPTLTNSHTSDGSGTGAFVSSLSGLSSNTLYYVRAYAVNSAGTSYGNEKSFTTLSQPVIPTVTTAPVTNITNTTAQSGGTITSDGGATVTSRGVCWSTTQNPTLANSHTSDGNGTGSYTSQMTGLTPYTFYYVRAYATNSVGTSYGSQITFMTLQTPTLATVTTVDALNITQTTATTGGTVMSDGGSIVTARGVCYATTSNPTLANSYTTDGSGTGTFVSNLTGLTPGTLYYVRAYATNNVGTAYGNQVTFTTLAWACGDSITINFVAGDVAPVNKMVTFGTVTNIPGEPSKCWITSNLGADHQATAKNDATEPSAGWYWQFNRKQGYKHDGTTRTPNTTWITNINENLDWQAANDPCTLEMGSGWRIPTSTEWTNVDASGNWTNWNGPWNSGLKMHAAGNLSGLDGSLVDRGLWGYYWSITQYDANFGWHLFFTHDGSGMGGATKNDGFTLRCLKP